MARTVGRGKISIIPGQLSIIWIKKYSLFRISFQKGKHMKIFRQIFIPNLTGEYVSRSEKKALGKRFL